MSKNVILTKSVSNHMINFMKNCNFEAEMFTCLNIWKQTNRNSFYESLKVHKSRSKRVNWYNYEMVLKFMTFSYKTSSWFGRKG